LTATGIRRIRTDPSISFSAVRSFRRNPDPLVERPVRRHDAEIAKENLQQFSDRTEAHRRPSMARIERFGDLLQELYAPAVVYGQP
jgi:hypothetical protein